MHGAGHDVGRRVRHADPRGAPAPARGGRRPSSRSPRASASAWSARPTPRSWRCATPTSRCTAPSGRASPGTRSTTSRWASRPRAASRSWPTSAAPGSAGEISVHYQPIVDDPDRSAPGCGGTRALDASAVRVGVARRSSSRLARGDRASSATSASRSCGRRPSTRARWRERRPRLLHQRERLAGPARCLVARERSTGSSPPPGLDPTALLIEITEGVVLSSLDESIRILEALARPRHADRDRRLRDRLLVALVRPSAPRRPRQDRPQLHERPRRHERRPDPDDHAAREDAGAQRSWRRASRRTEQLAELDRLECQLAQGYLFSPPVPSESFTQIVRRGVLDPRGRRGADAPTPTAESGGRAARETNRGRRVGRRAHLKPPSSGRRVCRRTSRVLPRS